jgi:hypothetical protein
MTWSVLLFKDWSAIGLDIAAGPQSAGAVGPVRVLPDGFPSPAVLVRDPITSALR